METNNKKKVILDLCGGTGAWSAPYKKNGYTVHNITLPDYDILKTEIRHLYKDMFFHGEKTLGISCDEIYGILAAPDCTQFSLARTRAKIERDFREGMKLVKACLNIIWECRYEPKYRKDGALKFWSLENPMGFLRQFLGKPVFTFDPCDFGDPYTKKTDLWGYFNIPKKSPIILTEEQIKQCKINNRKLPSISEITNSKQADKRAITPSGFANAFYKVNK